MLYLNPTPLDRNMEFDLKQNLFKNLAIDDRPRQDETAVLFLFREHLHPRHDEHNCQQPPHRHRREAAAAEFTSAMTPRRKHAHLCAMKSIGYVHWQDIDMWLGYLEEFPRLHDAGRFAHRHWRKIMREIYDDSVTDSSGRQIQLCSVSVVQ